MISKNSTKNSEQKRKEILMKLSNKILLGVFIGIFIITSALMVLSRMLFTKEIQSSIILKKDLSTTDLDEGEDTE